MGVWFGWGISQHLLSTSAITSQRAPTTEPALASVPSARLPVGDVTYSAVYQPFLLPLSNSTELIEGQVLWLPRSTGVAFHTHTKVRRHPFPSQHLPQAGMLPSAHSLWAPGNNTVLGAFTYLVSYTTHLISILQIIKLRLIEVPLPANGHIGPTTTST